MLKECTKAAGIEPETMSSDGITPQEQDIVLQRQDIVLERVSASQEFACAYSALSAIYMLY